MKEKTHYVIESALAVAIVVLFVLQLGGKGSPTAKVVLTGGDSTSKSALPMAYIDIDSLMANYTYSIDLYEQMAKKHENARANMTEKLRKLQAEAEEFQRKVNTGSFLSEERAKSEQTRILKKREELEQYNIQLQEELGEEQARMNDDLRKTIIMNLREYNKSKGYHIVYGRIGDNILLADDAYNITAEVIDYLNKQRTVSPASAE